jgi:methylisocitrate lyase
MKTTSRLRNLLKEEGLVVVMGAYDGLSARVVEKAGFPAVHITGYGLEASVLGSPDVGLLSFAEILERADRISSAVSIPTILDAEAGFGGPVQVRRAVKEFEKAGVAAIHIEDQLMPKKCGTLDGRMVIPLSEGVAKIKAAVDARTDQDFLIIARTDADIIGIEEVIERSQKYLEAGADMVFPVFTRLTARITPQQELELYRRFHREVKGQSVWIGADWDPAFTQSQIQSAGFKMLIYPVFTVLAAAGALRQVAEEIKSTGTPAGYLKKNPGLMTIGQFLEFMGMPEIQRWKRNTRVNRREGPVG